MDEIVAGELVGDIPGTVISGCRVEPGIVGNSIYFDGVSAWINLGNHRNRYVFNNIIKPCQNDRSITDILKCILLDENYCILMPISLTFLNKGPNDNTSALV